MKIRPVGAEMFHADGRTDMTKFLVAIRNLVKAPKTQATKESETSEETAFNEVHFSQYRANDEPKHR
jgi:hypothetical protein